MRMFCTFQHTKDSAFVNVSKTLSKVSVLLGDGEFAFKYPDNL